MDEKKVPMRRHPNCAKSPCDTCLMDHERLAEFFETKIGTTTDWLREYRDWLDCSGIPSETNGWASEEAFEPRNIQEFIDYCLDFASEHRHE